jgi:DNA (cytosine-5)-methyltransferase 1
MKFLSVCSGIEAASVAWEPLGWEAVAFSEIDKFPSAVLQKNFPNTPNLGDMTKFETWNIEKINLLCGGTPCQAFSVANVKNRTGLADSRSNLALTYLRMADHYRPEWLVWENVPGVLSSNGGTDFAAFLGALAKLGYGFAYRVLEARNFGLPCFRKRVWLVGHSGGWHRPAAALFGTENGGTDVGTVGTPVEATTRRRKDYLPSGDKPIGITSMGSWYEDSMPTLLKTGGAQVWENNEIRHLTAVEGERLMGFPDNWTQISDWKGGPKAEYRARLATLGNSWSVPVARWVGERIQLMS